MADRCAPNRLVVLIRGMSSVGGFPPSFIAFVRGQFPGCSVVVPRLPMGLLSRAEPDDLVDKAFRAVEQAVADFEPEEIIIIAYSAGALLARGLLVKAWGIPKNAVPPTDELGNPVVDPRPWAPKITRVVHISGILRGWSISTATPMIYRFAEPVLALGAHVISRLSGGRAMLFGFRRGAEFVVRNRLQYEALETCLRAGTARLAQRDEAPVEAIYGEDVLPTTIFLLGTKDQFMSPADVVDLRPRPHYFFLELPNTRHRGMIELDGRTPLAQCRRDTMRLALTGSVDDLQSAEICDEDIDDLFDVLDRPLRAGAQRRFDSIRHVVMVIHGIRDNGFWTKRVARMIKETGRDHQIEVRTPSPSYGFLPALDFLIPYWRNAQVRWFMEQYAEVRGLYPHAEIHFVGHSNGTFLAADAMERCPAIRFGRLYFAGSVVRTDYPWLDRLDQARHVLNVTAIYYWVVAWFPCLLEQIPGNPFNLGGAGFFGFMAGRPFKGLPKTASLSAAATDTSDLPLAIQNLGPVRGGHGEGITERFWPDIAAFAVSGQTPDLPEGTAEAGPFARLGGITFWCLILVWILVVPALITDYVMHEEAAEAARASVWILIECLAIFIAVFVARRL